jgi:hypothetical protein
LEITKEICLKGASPPNFFIRGGQSVFHTDSRLKHAGLTDFELSEQREIDPQRSTGGKTRLEVVRPAGWRCFLMFYAVTRSALCECHIERNPRDHGLPGFVFRKTSALDGTPEVDNLFFGYGLEEILIPIPVHHPD